MILVLFSVAEMNTLTKINLREEGFPLAYSAGEDRVRHGMETGQEVGDQLLKFLICSVGREKPGSEGSGCKTSTLLSSDPVSSTSKKFQNRATSWDPNVPNAQSMDGISLPNNNNG